MKEYIKVLIKRDGEQAAGKITEDIKAFAYWYKWKTKRFSSIEAAWTYFQDEVLNKDE